MNPSGSFKDNGMSAAFTHARCVGATPGRLRLDRQHQRLAGPVLLGHPADEGGDLHRLGQDLLRQALAGPGLRRADRADRRATSTTPWPASRRSAAQLGIYLVNSVNPFRLEGQKTIMYRVLEALRWEVPDWIVVPGGNLGNSSAFGKAFHELHELGLIDRMPRLAVINAAGANTLYELVEQRGLRWNGGRPDLALIDGYYARDGRRSTAGPRPSPAPSRSTGR